MNFNLYYIQRYRIIHRSSRLRLNRGRRLYARLVWATVLRNPDPRVAHWDAACAARHGGLWSMNTINGDAVHGMARHWWKLFGESTAWESFHPFLSAHGLDCRYRARDIARWRAKRDNGPPPVATASGYVENWPGAL